MRLPVAHCPSTLWLETMKRHEKGGFHRASAVDEGASRRAAALYIRVPDGGKIFSPALAAR